MQQNIKAECFFVLAGVQSCSVSELELKWNANDLIQKICLLIESEVLIC